MILGVDSRNLDKLVELGLKLWPDNSYSELKSDFESSLAAEDEDLFLYMDESSRIIGFIQLSIRTNYVEGCETSPVAYVEGVFVEENARRSGIAQEMVSFAESWGKQKGCKEIASDCELDNGLSIDFHKGIGFEEVNRLVCFVKKIDES